MRALLEEGKAPDFVLSDKYLPSDERPVMVVVVSMPTLAIKTGVVLWGHYKGYGVWDVGGEPAQVYAWKDWPPELTESELSWIDRDVFHHVSKSNASSPQPDPIPGKQRVLDVVINDLQERAESGRTKYGTYLETHNGRDPLWDAYQEAVDLVMYLRQALLEKGEEAVCYTDDIDPVWSSNQVITILIIAGVIGFVIGLLAG